MRHHHHQQPRTVAILVTNKLAGRPRPGAVLEYGGYDTKLLEAYPTELIEELLNGVDVLLLTPYLDAAVREAFLNARRSIPEAAQRIPVLSRSVSFQVALLDELAGSVSWQSLFDGLVREIEATLRSDAASVEALLVLAYARWHTQKYSTWQMRRDPSPLLITQKPKMIRSRRECQSKLQIR